LEILDLAPPEARRIIVFAVAMAWLVPSERRNVATWRYRVCRRSLWVCLVWDEQTTREEVAVCHRTWLEDGFEPNYRLDSRGYFYVGLPRRKQK
jgi:hypothetical protein